MIADDEPIECIFISRIIEKHFQNELEIVKASNGREVLKQYEENPFQIALLDIEMPGITGLDAAEEIRKKDKSCMIIFLTAFDEFQYAKRAITVRAMDYLLKPTTDEELTAVIEEAIRQIRESAVIPVTAENPEKTENTGDAEKAVSEDPDGMGSEDDMRMDGKGAVMQQMILRYIEAHYMEDLSLQELSERMNYAEAYFCKLFRQLFSVSFTVYLTRYRIEKSKLLLMDITTNIREVGELVGYRDANYFAKVFKRMVGVTPSEYRAEHMVV